jgi:hypothetical protein
VRTTFSYDRTQLRAKQQTLAQESAAKMCRAFGQFCSVALLLGIICAAAGAEVAAKAWASALITNDSTDQVSSVTAGGTGKEEFVIIAGDVNAKRGEEIGLQGLVASHHSETNSATNETFADAFVAKVDSATRKLIWVYRYEAGEDYSEKSKYFDVTYSAEKNRVFAVGHKKDKATRTYAPVLTILDGTSGSDISTVIHDVGLNGNAQYTSAAVHGDSVYICGSDTSGKSGGNKPTPRLTEGLCLLGPRRTLGRSCGLVKLETAACVIDALGYPLLEVAPRYSSQQPHIL